MAGTREGGLIAAAKNKATDPDYYHKLGKMGGSVKVPKGFAVNRKLARTAGRLGGRKRQGL